MFQLPQFVWTLHSYVQVVFNNFHLIEVTDKSKLKSKSDYLSP